MKTLAPQRFIYVIGPLEGAQKVGLTTDPRARLATLQTGCPHELVIHVAVRVPFAEAHAVERRTHQQLERWRARNEWFDVTPDAAMALVLAAAKPSNQKGTSDVKHAALQSVLADGLPLFAFGRGGN